MIQFHYHGVVYDSVSTEPIAEATVTGYWRSRETMEYEASRVTDSSGCYSITFFEVPVEELHCSKEGYHTLVLVNQIPTGCGGFGREHYYINLDLWLVPEDSASAGG